MPFVSNPVHGLSLDGLQFVANGQTVVHTDAPSGETYMFEVAEPDTQWGNPQPVTVALLTMLTNGSQVSHLRDDNREPTIALTVKASGAAALAAAEVDLRAATGKSAELVWQPSASAAAATVFDVVWSQLDHQMDSWRERWFWRSYTISLQALPHARSEDKVITPAVATVAPTVVDAGASTTNWSAIAPSGATLSVVSGAVRLTYNPATATSGVYGATMRRTATVSTTTEKYISVDWKTSISSIYALQTSATGNLPEVRREPAPTAGFTRSWFQVPDSVTSIAWLQFVILHPAYPSGSATLDIDQVLLANALPASGTGRQLTRTIAPGGSVAAEGSIKVEHASSGLGSTVVYTHPVQDGYSPPLRPWLDSAGTETTYAAGISGKYNALDVDWRVEIPSSSVPTGDVQLWASLSRSTAGSQSIAWAARSAVGTGVGDSQLGSITANFAVANTFYLFPIARLALPVTRVGPAGHVAIVINAFSASVVLDEAWLFAMDKGRLTVVDCGTGTPLATSVHNRLRIDAPSIDEPNGAIMIGTASDWSDTYVPTAPKVPCDQVGHRFDPEGALIFTVTAGVADASVSLEHYRRWHTHAGS